MLAQEDMLAASIQAACRGSLKNRPPQILEKFLPEAMVSQQAG